MFRHSRPGPALTRLPLLASISNDGVIRRWHALTLTPWGDPLTYAPRVDGLAASTAPDGRTLLAAYCDVGTGIRRWDATTGTTIGTVLSHGTSSLSAIAAWTGPDGHIMLACGDFDGRIRRWDATTGVLVPPRLGPRGIIADRVVARARSPGRGRTARSWLPWLSRASAAGMPPQVLRSANHPNMALIPSTC